MENPETIKRLREISQASMLDCKEALEASRGDLEDALARLKTKGLTKAAKKLARDIGPGIVDAYIHAGGKVGAMVELRCETDFVARNEEFKKLAHEICLQIASMAPLWIAPEDIPGAILEDEKKRIREEFLGIGKKDAVLEKAVNGKLENYFDRVCLLRQPYIKDQGETIEELIAATISKVGENIKVSNFCRFEI